MSKISTNELAKYAVDELEAGKSASSVAQNLSAFLLDERRTRDAAAIMRAVDAELARRGTDHVTITSAHEVASEIKNKLASLLGAKDPIFSEVIDESVIGGVKAQSGENQIDLTVRAKLQRFKSEVMRSN